MEVPLFPFFPSPFCHCNMATSNRCNKWTTREGVPFHPENSCTVKVSKNQLTLLPMFPLENNIIKEQQGYKGVRFRAERERVDGKSKTF